MPRVPRFVVSLPVGVAAGYSVTLPPDIAHQVGRVLRLRPADPVVLIDGSGGEWHATLDHASEAGRRSATVSAFSPQRPEDCVRPVTLVIGLLKGEKFDWVVQKATELGVARIVPVITARAVPSGSRPDRWRRIAVEATEQCGRTKIPIIEDPRPFREVVAAGRADAMHLACWEEASGTSYFDLVRATPERPLQCYIGPEGGFTGAEIDLARSSGVEIVTLGARILRSETAAIAVIALATA